MIKKKLLVCTTEYYPYGSGIANVAHKIVEQLKRKGIDCEVCSPTGPDIFLGNRQLAFKAGRIGILFYWLCVSKYFNTKHTNKYDIVWLHQPLFLYKNPFQKCLITIHTTSLGHYKATRRLNYPFYLRIYYLISLIIEKYCTKRITGTKIITDSPEVSKEVNEIIGIFSKPEYIPNGVDISRFNPKDKKRNTREQIGVDPDSTAFISVGRITEVKRPFLMVDLFNSIHKVIEKSTFIIVGEGNKLNELKEYVSKKNIPNIKFMGFVGHDYLPSLLSCSNYYLMTSEYEGQPLTLLEAMASGLPCIVSNIPTLRIVEEADCGIVVDFSDIEKASKKIIDYVSNDNSEHARNARQYAERNLDWNIIAEKYIEVFRQIK